MAMEFVYKYLLIGGMPEVVEAYIDGENILESREILKVLYASILFFSFAAKDLAEGKITV